jgi:hypothetical protein
MWEFVEPCFVATAFIHHTHHVLDDEEYFPKTPTKIGLFQEMQTLMYAVFEEQLKTDTGKLLVSQYKMICDAQSIYSKELKMHAKSSTAALLSGGTLLNYITSARLPGT